METTADAQGLDTAFVVAESFFFGLERLGVFQTLTFRQGSIFLPLFHESKQYLGVIEFCLKPQAKQKAIDEFLAELTSQVDAIRIAMSSWAREQVLKRVLGSRRMDKTMHGRLAVLLDSSLITNAQMILVWKPTDFFLNFILDAWGPAKNPATYEKMPAESISLEMQSYCKRLARETEGLYGRVYSSFGLFWINIPGGRMREVLGVGAIVSIRGWNESSKVFQLLLPEVISAKNTLYMLDELSKVYSFCGLIEATRHCGIPCREDLILQMAKYKGNVSKTASGFGVNRVTMYKWLRRHAIDPREFRSRS